MKEMLVGTLGSPAHGSFSRQELRGRRRRRASQRTEEEKQERGAGRRGL